jgi:hypothetical protein
MPFYKRGFRFPYPGEKHSILWEIAGFIVLAANVHAVA